MKLDKEYVSKKTKEFVHALHEDDICSRVLNWTTFAINFEQRYDSFRVYLSFQGDLAEAGYEAVDKICRTFNSTNDEAYLHSVKNHKISISIYFFIDD